MSSRRAVPLLVALCLSALPLAPVAHVHAATTHDGQTSLVIHRHGTPHHAHAHHAADTAGHRAALHHHDENSHATDTDDDDGAVVLTLEPIFAAPHAYVLAAPVAIVERLLRAPTRGEPRRAAVYVERIIHAPPRAPAILRGPPAGPVV